MNVVGNLLTAYYNLLNGKTTFPVYKLTVPEDVLNNYIWLYPEIGADNNNKSSRNDTIIIRVDIISSFQNDAGQAAIETADTIINELIVIPGNNTGLIAPAGLQFLNVHRENYQYLIERSGSGVVYRKISRYNQRVHQTA